MFLMTNVVPSSSLFLCFPQLDFSQLSNCLSSCFLLNFSQIKTFLLQPIKVSLQFVNCVSVNMPTTFLTISESPRTIIATESLCMQLQTQT